MIQLLSRGVCFLVLFSITQWASALTYTIEVPKQIIEDQISAELPTPEVKFDDDERPVSVDFQAMLERMRSGK